MSNAWIDLKFEIYDPHDVPSDLRLSVFSDRWQALKREENAR